MDNSLDDVSDPTDDLSNAFRKVVHFVLMLSLITADDVENGLWNPTMQKITLVPKAHCTEEPLKHNPSSI